MLLIITEFGVVRETYNSSLDFISSDICRWADELKSLNVYWVILPSISIGLIGQYLMGLFIWVLLYGSAMVQHIHLTSGFVTSWITGPKNKECQVQFKILLYNAQLHLFQPTRRLACLEDKTEKSECAVRWICASKMKWRYGAPRSNQQEF